MADGWGRVEGAWVTLQRWVASLTCVLKGGLRKVAAAGLLFFPQQPSISFVLMTSPLHPPAPTENLDLVRAGCVNLARHIANARCAQLNREGSVHLCGQPAVADSMQAARTQSEL